MGITTNRSYAASYFSRKRNRVSTAVVADVLAPAWGTIVFPANPSNLHTININGTVLTLVTGTPGAGQIKIGLTLSATIAAILVYLAAHPIAGAVVSASGNGLLVLSTKAGDTSVTLAASAATVSGAALVRQNIAARTAK